MKNLDPNIRGCRFASESENLVYHSRYKSLIWWPHEIIWRYSRTSCQAECGLKKAASTSDCLPWSWFATSLRISPIFLRYLPHGSGNYKKACRLLFSTNKIIFTKLEFGCLIVRLWRAWIHLLPSSTETQQFLKMMRNVTDSECGCLPDCDFLDLQHSVTANNLM